MYKPGGMTVAFLTFLLTANRFLDTEIIRTQLTFTCSKSTVEVLEKGMKYVQSEQ